MLCYFEGTIWRVFLPSGSEKHILRLIMCHLLRFSGKNSDRNSLSASTVWVCQKHGAWETCSSNFVIPVWQFCKNPARIVTWGWHLTSVCSFDLTTWPFLLWEWQHPVTIIFRIRGNSPACLFAISCRLRVLQYLPLAGIPCPLVPWGNGLILEDHFGSPGPQPYAVYLWTQFSRT